MAFQPAMQGQTPMYCLLAACRLPTTDYRVLRFMLVWRGYTLISIANIPEVWRTYPPGASNLLSVFLEIAFQ